MGLSEDGDLSEANEAGLPVASVAARQLLEPPCAHRPAPARPDGRLFGREDIGDTAGSCYGSCTHVWTYKYATPFLFGALARGMRDTEFAYATDADGLMSFRIGLPLDKEARTFGIAAADGQFGARSNCTRVADER